MEYTIHRVSLDIHSVKSQATLRVKQSDTSRKLHITLCEGGLPYQIAKDCYATFSALKADGNYIHNTCQIDGNTIEYVFTEQTTAAVGNTDCEITLYDNKGQRITSPHFTIIVEERVYNGEEILSSPEANVLDELIDRAEVAVDNAEKVVDSIYHYVENNFANAFKGNAEGAIVQADDVSPVEHVIKVRVNSKNLVPPFTQSITTPGNHGLTFVCEAGGQTITLNGSTTAGGGRTSLRDAVGVIHLEAGVTYTLSQFIQSGTGENADTFLNNRNTSDVIARTNSGKSTVFTVAEDTDAYIGVNAQIGVVYENLVVAYQLEKGNTATEYTPFIDVGTVKVSRNGEEFSVSPDGTINGMTSHFPAMTIYSNTAGTVIECEYNKDSNKVVQKLYDYITGETMPPVTKISSVNLLTSEWIGDASPYSQVVSISGVTENSMVDLTPSVEQLAIFYNKDLAFVTENVGGVVTVYAIGQKPTNDYTIQVAITEVEA